MSKTVDNATQYALLGLLCEAPMTGYDIKAAYDGSVTYFWNVSYGQIYPGLKRLVGRGYATVREERRPKRPARKVYRITAAGRRAFREWLAKPPAVRRVRNEVALKLFFGIHGRVEDQIAHMEALGAEHERRLQIFREFERAAEARAAPEEVLPLLSLRMGIAGSEALVRWARESVRTLREVAGSTQSGKSQGAARRRRTKRGED